MPASGHRHARRQKPGDRVVQGDLAAKGHVGQQKRGERLGDGADLEHRVGVQRPRISPARRAVADDAAAGSVDDADDHADAFALAVDALADDLANLRVRS